MKRGDVFLADLHPRSVSEQRGRRPVIVVSRDSSTSPAEMAVVDEGIVLPSISMVDTWRGDRVGFAPRVLSVNHRSRAGRCPRG